jgi:3-hydroxyacyl-CoA dehydrogenase
MSDVAGPVAVVGTGTIGAAWAALFLSRGLVVHASDPGEGADDRLVASLLARGCAQDDIDARLRWYDDAAEAVAGTVFVQESAPEVPELKARILSVIDGAAPPSTVIASSSSGLTPTSMQQACARHPERLIVGHPFHPADVVPLVEVVGGAATALWALESAMSFYAGLGKRPVHVRAELPGHVVNRLQAALWREAYSLVQQGVVTVADVDAAITQGPGLRWAVVGPFAGQHLSGGPGGIAHTLEHLGPPMVEWWGALGQPTWGPELVAAVVEQMDAELDGLSSERLAAARDRVLVQILAARAAEADLPR